MATSVQTKKWLWQPLEEVSSVISKGTTPSEYIEHGIPFLRAEDVTGGAVNVQTVSYHISDEVHKSFARSQLLAGDLLITIAGTLGRVGYVPEGVSEVNCNQAVAFIRLDPKKMDYKFACLMCRSMDVISSLIDLKKVGTIGNLNLEQVRGLKLPVPSLREQVEVVQMLEKAERVRRLHLEEGRQIENLFQGLLQSVLASQQL